MLSEMLRVEAERRWPLLVLLLASFLAVPLLYLWSFGVSPSPGAARVAVQPAFTAASVAALGVLATALVWGAGVWTVERATGWVYALSLPVGRLRLFTLRYLAGLAWLAVAVAAAAAAAAAVAAAVRLPPGIYAYPGPYAAWMAGTAWFCYTLAFVISAALERPLRWLLVPILLLLAFQYAVPGNHLLFRWRGEAGWLHTAAGLSPVRIIGDFPPFIEH